MFGETQVFTGLVTSDTPVRNEGIQSYENAEAVAPHRPLAYVLHAQALAATGQFEEAYRIIRIALAKRPQYELAQNLQKDIEIVLSR